MLENLGYKCVVDNDYVAYYKSKYDDVIYINKQLKIIRKYINDEQVGLTFDEIEACFNIIKKSENLFENTKEYKLDLYIKLKKN